MGEQNYGIDVNVARSVAEEIKAVNMLGVQVAVVVGGGNIFRGVSKSAGNMDRSSADYIGMLATVMNAVVLQDALEKIDVQTRVLSAVDIPQLADEVVAPFGRTRTPAQAVAPSRSEVPDRAAGTDRALLPVRTGCRWECHRCAAAVRRHNCR